LRVLGGVLSFFALLLSLPLFRAFCWSCGFTLFYMIFLSFSRLFGLRVVLHGALDLNFKLCAFVVNGLNKGEIKKLSGQFLGLIVISH
jgi:hypothetical protein